MDDKKPTRGFPQVGCDDARDNRHYSPDTLPLVVVKDVARIESRIIAEQLGRQHESVIRQLTVFASDFDQLGALPVRSLATEYSDLKSGNAKRGRPQKSLMLNEDQAYLLLAYSRNSTRVRAFKVRLVQAFRQARDAVEIAKDYLPGYHQLQNEAKHLAEVAHAAGSTTPERTFHININRLVNNACGVEPGQRASLTPQQRMAVTSAGFVAQKAIASALDAGADHHEAYAVAKAQVQRYASGAALLLGV